MSAAHMQALVRDLDLTPYFEIAKAPQQRWLAAALQFDGPHGSFILRSVFLTNIMLGKVYGVPRDAA